MIKTVRLFFVLVFSIISLSSWANMDKESVGAILQMMVDQGQITQAQADEAKKEMLQMNEQQWNDLHKKAQNVIDKDDRLKKLQKANEAGKGETFVGSPDQVDLIKDAVKN